jgi:oxysterol-binding protein-related protein 1/2
MIFNYKLIQNIIIIMELFDFKILELASAEKLKLEEKQRESRKNRTEEYKGLWFDSAKHKYCNDDVWIFNHKYWKRDFKNCPDIY